MSQDLPLSAQLLPATLGGIPTKTVDIPICTVLLVCYLGMAGTHMTIYRHNRAHGRTFRPSVFCFALCMARLVTFTMRIVWAVEPKNRNVAIVSNVFIAAGVILLVCAVVPLQRRGTAVERGSGRRMMDACANEVPDSGSSTASSPRGCLASTTRIHIRGPYFDLGYAACPTLSCYAVSHSVRYPPLPRLPPLHLFFPGRGCFPPGLQTAKPRLQ
jgi:hypothetical protein